MDFINLSIPPFDLYLKLKELEKDYEIVAVGLEKVHAIQGTSAGSNFKFGYNCGSVTALLCTLNTSIYELTPAIWQKHIGLPARNRLTPALRKKHIKKGVGEICNKLYPSAKIHGVRGGLLDGRSDALMIAHTTLYRNKLDKD